MLMAHEKVGSSDPIVLDSGASTHMVRRREWLHNIQGISPKKIMLGNGATIVASEMGDIELRVRISREGLDPIYRNVDVENILFAPDLGANLLCCAKLCRTGYTVNFERRKWEALREESIQFEGKLYDGYIQWNMCLF